MWIIDFLSLSFLISKILLHFSQSVPLESKWWRNLRILNFLWLTGERAPCGAHKLWGWKLHMKDGWIVITTFLSCGTSESCMNNLLLLGFNPLKIYILEDVFIFLGIVFHWKSLTNFCHNAKKLFIKQKQLSSSKKMSKSYEATTLKTNKKKNCQIHLESNWNHSRGWTRAQ